MRPKGNGIVDIVDERTLDNKSFFCMHLVQFIESTDYDSWITAFEKAKKGRCPYRRRCDKFKKTLLWKRKTRLRNSAAKRSTGRRAVQANTPAGLPTYM